tara:strand:+ start:2602 stop:2988 length:387 start_codon:yes stop_codon:yes gene_type:complete
MASSKWRYFFWVAAVYNFAAGLMPMLAPEASAASAGLPIPEGLNIFNMQIMGAMICTFGIGYAMVALGRPGAFEIVLMGLIGKLALCVLLVINMQSYVFPQTVVVATAGDFIFVILFAIFLMRGPTKA